MSPPRITSSSAPASNRWFKLTVTDTDGYCTKLSKSSVRITIFYQPEHGQDTFQPVEIKTGATLAWEEPFTFSAHESDDVSIQIFYRDNDGEKDILLNETTESLVKLQNDGPEITKFLAPLSEGAPFKLTIRIELPSIVSNHIFSLIIGINDYKYNSRLEGCVNDAFLVKNFLKQHLGVPDCNIEFLIDEKATRAAILSGLQVHLTQNGNIQRGDAIIIYYAGHGSRVATPQSWGCGSNTIEALCPYDQDDDFVHCIPDRTLGALLRNLANSKGDNITVIMDCCHSGGMTREALASDPTGRVRYIFTSSPIPDTLDQAIWDTPGVGIRGARIPPALRDKAMSSHVLIAACQQNQAARETRTTEGICHGIFTECLVRQLEGSALHQFTYSTLIDKISSSPDLASQLPQCEGANKHRILFKDLAIPVQPKTFRIREENDTYRIEIGEAHGVVPGTEFSVRERDLTSPDKEIGTLLATDVAPDSSILERAPGGSFDIPLGARVVVTKWNNPVFTIKVFIQPDARQPVPRSLAAGIAPAKTNLVTVEIAQPPDRRFSQVDSRGCADLVVHRTGTGPNELSFERLDPYLLKYAESTAGSTLRNDPNALARALDAIAHFNFHLDRTNHHNPLKAGLALNLQKLEKQNSEYGPILVPIGENLLQCCHIPYQADALYGFTLSNNTDHDLYPYLFYFDPVNYSIQNWYHPQCPAMSPPLAKSNSPSWFLEIGYGAGGADPFEFTEPPGGDDVGFIKLFVFTKYVEMEWICQGPLGELPIGSARGTTPGSSAGSPTGSSAGSTASGSSRGSMKRAHVNLNEIDEAVIWDALVYPAAVYKPLPAENQSNRL